MSSAADLAQELLDTILDFLHDDRRSLLSSSLVARKWVPAPRYHIFERIAINHFFTGHQGYHRFRDTAHTFLAIGRSPSCTILPAVRNVVLNVDTEFNGASRLLEEIVEVLARAPVNKILLIDHTSSLADHPISLSWIAPHFPRLQEFSYNALDDIVEDVFALVASFPSLRSLAVYSAPRGGFTALAHGKSPPAVPHAAFAHLHTLRLRLYGRQSEELFAWMQSSTDQLRLETLDLNFYHCYHNGWGPVATLNSFLRANAGHLRSLALRVTYDDSEGDVDDELRVTKPADGEVDLSCLPNLRSLYLSSHNVEAICSILKSAPPTLEVLEVDFTSWIYYEEAPCMCDPGVLVYDFAAVMKEDRFARLTSFDIRVPEFFGEQGKEMLKEYFPRWKNTNNILRVSYINSSFYQADSWQTVRELMFGVPEL